jgi:signal transduction histidine kinase
VRERIGGLGGNVQIESVPEKGTHVTIQFSITQR